MGLYRGKTCRRWTTHTLFATLFAVFLIVFFNSPVPSSRGWPNGLSEDPFEIHEEYRPYVDFWLSVFTSYDGRHMLLIDSDEPWNILKVLVFDQLDPLEESLPGEFIKILRDHKNEVREICNELDESGEVVANKTPVHQWLWSLYGKRAESHPGLFKLVGSRLRWQRGMRDKMKMSLWRMDFYLPHVKRVFRTAQLPEDLAYLPLVESGFNPYAGSFAGARGLWQFMPKAAKAHGLIVGLYIDQRYDPIYSSEAAVRYLRKAYEQFGRWSLALTSYNHGVEGISRAIRETGTWDWERIVKEYRGPYFGFASKNFYAEFLAAREIARRREEFFPDPPAQPFHPWEFGVISLPETLPIRRIPHGLNMGTEEFLQYNPQFLLTAFIKDIQVLKGTPLRIPILNNSGVLDGMHIVRPGETLRRISQTYHISLERILLLNPNINVKRLLPGTTVRVAPKTNESEQTTR